LTTSRGAITHVSGFSNFCASRLHAFRIDSKICSPLWPSTASGTQIKERLGSTQQGWTKRKAERELRARLAEVEQRGYKRPERMTFSAFAQGWIEEATTARGLKRSTSRSYRQILANHLEPAFGSHELAEITVEQVERYIVGRRRAGFSAATVNRTLNVLSLVLKAALRRGLVRTNVVTQVDRPRERRRRWRIFSPAEVAAIERAFDELIHEAGTERDRDDRIVTRRLFLTHMASGLRRGEAAGLRWRSLALADPDGPTLRVEETFVRHAADTPKSEAGCRTISLGERLAGELFERRSWSAFAGDDELVFPNPRTGRSFDANRYAEILRLALSRAGIDGYVRPSHDLRHSSITNAAAAGTSPEALMSRAGHSSYSTTRRYVDLAGERFRDEAERLERRLWGGSGTKSRSDRRLGVSRGGRRRRHRAWLAAGVGFEPTVPREGHSGFQDRPVRPLRHPAVVTA
jgi:site-specific recombinase XerD